MTEAQWLASGDPRLMLELIRGKISDRKLLLFSGACCRRVAPLLSDPTLIRLLEVAEQFVEKRASAEDCRTASRRAFDYHSASAHEQGRANNVDLAMGWAVAVRPTGVYPVDYANYVVENTCRLGDRWIEGQPLTEPQQQERACQSGLLREIVGNPFRPVEFSADWRTDTAVSLAKQMYESRDFGAMPILADALQDAGCDNDDVLTHCRGAGPHVRGCWVVDLVLGGE